MVVTPMPIPLSSLGPLVMMPIYTVGKKVRTLAKRAQERIADITSVIFETLTGMRVVKAFSMEDYERKKFLEKRNGKIAEG